MKHPTIEGALFGCFGDPISRIFQAEARHSKAKGQKLDPSGAFLRPCSMLQMCTETNSNCLVKSQEHIYI